MKKQLIVFVIVFLLFLVSLNGCIQNSNDTSNNVKPNDDANEPDLDSVFSLRNSSPKIYNRTASNDASDYLGDRIAFEAFSDWKNYSPLIEKVNEIINGLNTNYEKFWAIANYVVSCREYGKPSPANELKSVIDIFESDSGICLDASILCTAMLRIAGIPARSVTPNRFHEFNQVFIDNSWISFDITFGRGEPCVINSLNRGYHPFFVFSYNKSYVNFSGYNDKLLSEVHFFDRKVCSSPFIKTECGEGTLVYPFISTPIYYNSTLQNSTQNEILKIYVEKDDDYQDISWFETSAFEVIDDFDVLFNCDNPLNCTKTHFTFISNLANYYWGLKEDGSKSTDTIDYNGYIERLLPAFKFRMYYKTRILGYELAYYDFEIEDGQTTIIKSEDIKKAPGASQENFDVLINLINKLPSYNSLK